MTWINVNEKTAFYKKYAFETANMLNESVHVKGILFLSALVVMNGYYTFIKYEKVLDYLYSLEKL